jgi:hypothetical protein
MKLEMAKPGKDGMEKTLKIKNVWRHLPWYLKIKISPKTLSCEMLGFEAQVQVFL